jgi:hypothetical protein
MVPYVFLTQKLLLSSQKIPGIWKNLSQPRSGIRIQGLKKPRIPDPQHWCSPVHDGPGNVMKETAGKARRVGLLGEQAATHPVVIMI